MTVKQLTATLEGNMRFVATNPAGRTLVMDDYEGGGGPSPIETILASLAGCTGMDVISILRKKRVAFSAYRVETTADQKDTYPQVFTRVDVIHVVEGEGIVHGRRPPRGGAVGAQVLPGERDARRGHGRDPPRLPDRGAGRHDDRRRVRRPRAARAGRGPDELTADAAHGRQHRPPRR